MNSNTTPIKEMNIAKICNRIACEVINRKMKMQINNEYELRIVIDLLKLYDEPIDEVSIGCFVYIEPESVCTYDYATVLKFTVSRDEETFKNSNNYHQWDISIDDWRE